MKQNHQIILAIAIAMIALVGAAYLVVFGQALYQPENHVGIILALPKAAVTGVARVDKRTYLARSREMYLRLMGERGFTLKDQIGSAYVFTKEGFTAGFPYNEYLVSSRMYSSRFMLFTEPPLLDPLVR